ncbi:MAG: RDD family protein [Pseudomonadota bacterium]
MTDTKKPSFMRRAAAGILDFLTVFVGGGLIIANVTGDTTEGGFQLNGIPALILFAIIIVYFVVGWRYAGGTIWQRILRAR